MFTVHEQFPEQGEFHVNGIPDGAVDDLLKYGACLVEMPELLGIRDRLDVLEERRFALSAQTKKIMTELEISAATNKGNIHLQPERGFESSTAKEVFHFTHTDLTISSPFETQPRISSTKPRYNYDNRENHFREFLDEYASVATRILFPELKYSPARRRSLDEIIDACYRDIKVYWGDAIIDGLHTLSLFRYHASNAQELHSPPHIDDGLVSIVDNPNDLEVYVDGAWHPLGPPSSPTTVAVLVGYTLESITSGMFRAVQHRVRNNGALRTRVAKMRLAPDLNVYFNGITSKWAAERRERVPVPNDFLLVEDIMKTFHSKYRGVDALVAQPMPVTTLRNSSEASLDSSDNMGLFSGLPAELIFNILSWLLDDLRDTIRVAGTCRSLRKIAGNEEHIIPAAGILWDFLLDEFGGTDPGIATVAQAFSYRHLETLMKGFLYRKETKGVLYRKVLLSIFSICSFHEQTKKSGKLVPAFSAQPAKYPDDKGGRRKRSRSC